MARKKTTKRAYGFAIVGCGMISEVHARAIAEIPGARLVAVCDFVEAAARRRAEEHDCDAYTNVKEMVKRDDVDIVCVCTPSGAHRDPAVAAARAGKHVAVEKPIEITLQRADAIIRAADAAGVRLATIFPSRFAEVTRVLKKAVDAGRFGRITIGDCYNKWWRTQEYYDSGGWRGTWKLDGGGALMNQAIHAIDLIQWLMGPVDSITALTDCLVHERIEVEDTAVAAVRFANGALGVIEATTSVYPGMTRRIEIHGDRGTVVLDNRNITQWEFARGSSQDARIRKKHAPPAEGGKMWGVSDPRVISHANHKKQLVDLIESVETGRPVYCDGREGRKSVEIILAIYKSARASRPVKLPLRPLSPEPPA